MASVPESQYSADRNWRTPLMIACVCGPLIAGGVVLTNELGAAGSATAMTLGDVSDAALVELRDHRGNTVLSGEFRSHVDMAGNTEKDAALINRNGERVIGEVELEIPARGRTDRRPELEVDVIGLPAREVFTIVIDDRAVGSFATDDRGSVDMEIQEGEEPSPFPKS
jgi:hypothetical protein